MGFRDRGIEIKTREQIDLMRVAGLARRARPSSCCAPPCGRASPPVSSTGSPRTTSAPTAACRRSWATATRRSRRTICASVNDEVVHGIPGERVLAEGDVISIDCGAIVDGWHGDAAITVAVGARSPTDGRRAAAGHRGVAVARHRRRPPRRPGHRHLPRRRDPRPRPGRATASSRTTSATASAPRCTSRPTCPTSAGPAAAPSWSRGWRSPSSRWSRSAASDTDLLEDEWTVVTADGSLAAHFEHTFTLTPHGPWVLTAARRRRGAPRPRSASRSAAADRFTPTARCVGD